MQETPEVRTSPEAGRSPVTVRGNGEGNRLGLSSYSRGTQEAADPCLAFHGRPRPLALLAEGLTDALHFEDELWGHVGSWRSFPNVSGDSKGGAGWRIGVME